jgi:hypothetical protein
MILLTNDLPPLLSLACGWPLGRMALCLCEWRHLHVLGLKYLRMQRKGGPNRPLEWARPAGLGRLAQAHPDPVQSPLRSRGSSCIYALCPLHLHQDGGSSCMKFGILRFNPRGCSFVTFRSLRPLGVISTSSQTWTRLLNCSFELVAPSFMSMFSYKNIILPNTHTKMNCLQD